MADGRRYYKAAFHIAPDGGLYVPQEFPHFTSRQFESDFELPPRFKRSAPPGLPEVDEPTLVRHYTQISERNFAIDNAFYPLGSCTMKYNPKVNDAMPNLPGLRAEAVRREALLGWIDGLAGGALPRADGAPGVLDAERIVSPGQAGPGAGDWRGSFRRFPASDTSQGENKRDSKEITTRQEFHDDSFGPTRLRTAS